MKKIFLILIVSVIAFTASSQGWMQYLPNDKLVRDELTFYDYQAAFNRWCKEWGIDNTGYYYKDGEKLKACGWKQFKRWEVEMRGAYNTRTGEFFDRDIIQRMKEYYQRYPQYSRSLEGNWVNLGYGNPPGDYYGVGRINCLEFHPSDPHYIWIGSASGGMWRTTDFGETWEPLTDFLAHTSIGAIAVPKDYESSQTIYLGTGDRSQWSARGAGIWKSTDGGQTWQETGLSSDFTDLYICGLAVNSEDNNIVYAITSDGFYKTSDAGLNWTNLKSCHGIDMEFNPADSSIIYISTRIDDDNGNSKIFRTVDGGQTWTEVLSVHGVRTELAVSPDEPSWVYAVISDSIGGLKAVFRSTDSGASFAMVFDGTIWGNNILNSGCNGLEEGGQGSYDLAICSNPLDAEEVYIGGINLWKSTNHGQDWIKLTHWSGGCAQNTDIVHADQHWLEFFQDSDTLLACNDGGLYYTNTGGGWWYEISFGLVINQIYRLSNSRQTSNEIIFGLQDNSSMLWTGGDLMVWPDGDGTECMINPFNDDFQFRSSNAHNPYYTTNHWDTYHSFESVPDSCGWFKVFRVYPNHYNWVLWGMRNLWISYDHGANFDLYVDLPDNSDILEFEIAPSNPDVVYVSNNNNFYKSTSDGRSLITLTNNIPYDPFYIYRMEIKNDDENTIWITNTSWQSGNRVMKSVDGGLTWQDISAGLPDIPTYDIIQNDLVTDYVQLYVCTFQGIYVKLGDEDWLPFSNGLPNIPLSDLDIFYDGSDSRLRVGTWGRGFWESPVYSTNTESPGIWTGTVSSSWFDLNNWLYHAVPGGLTNVTIPKGCANYPDIHSLVQCNKLKIEAGGKITLSQSSLNIGDSLISSGQMIFDGNNASLVVEGTMMIKRGSSIQITDQNLQIHLYGNLVADGGSPMSAGTFFFKGDQNSYITFTYNPFQFNNLTLDKSPGVKVIYSQSSESDLVVNGNLDIRSGNIFRFESTNVMDLKGEMTNSGTYQFYSGTFIYHGGTMTLNSNSECFFNDFNLISMNSTFSLGSDLEIRGNLQITLGTFAPGANTVKLKGDYGRDLEHGNFLRNGSRLMFTGSYPQTCTADTFNIIELNKPADTLLINTDIVCEQFDWTAGCLKITGGSFTANDLAESGIYGNYMVSGGTINLHNNDFVDLNGFINLSGGTFNVHGGAWASYWPHTSEAGLTMSGGVLDFKNQSIYLYDVGAFSDVITGGVIRTAGGFSGERHDFNPAGGHIELYGSNDCALAHGIGSSFYKIVIDKAGTDAAGPLQGSAGKELPSSSKTSVLNIPGTPALKTGYQRPGKTTGRVENDGTIYPYGTRSSKVTVYSTLDIDNDLDIQSGELDISDQTVDLEGALRIYGHLTMSDPMGELHADDVFWYPEGTEDVTAGDIYFSGDWSFQNNGNHHLSGTSSAIAEGSNLQRIFLFNNQSAFNDLTIAKSGSLATINISPGFTLQIDKDLTVTPGSTLQILEETNINVDSVLLIEDDGIMTLEGTSVVTAGKKLQLDGTLQLNSTPAFYCNKAFEQGATGQLTINGGSFILDEPYSGTLHAFAGTTDLNGGTFEITNNGIQLGTGAVYNFNGGNMRIGWGFKAVYSGSFQPSQGTVEMMGNRAGSIEIHPDNYFYNLLLNKGTYTVFGMDSILVSNDLTINSGSLDMLGNRLSIGNDLIINPSGNLDPGDGIVRISGDWFNNRGAAGFTQGLSTVTFQGVKNSTVSNSESFYNLRLDKPVSFADDLFFSAGTTTDVLNRFDILDGVAHPDDNTTLNVTGNLFIANGAGLDAGYGAPVNINLYQNWTDANTSFSASHGFNPGTSTVSFLGGEEIYYYSAGTGNFYDLVINKTTDAFLTESNFLIQRDFDLIAGDFDNAEPGLTYDFKRDFTIHSGATWYDSTSTIRFSGSGRQSFVDESTASLKFKDIVVEMTSVADSDPFVILYNDLRCYDDLDILEGDLKLNGQALECGHQLNILTGGKLSALDNSTIKMGDGGQVILSGGTLDLIGTSPGYSTVTRQSTGYYSFTLNALSTLNASRTIFEFMDANGINILNNSTIGTGHQFNDCIFRRGISGGTLMTVSSKQTLTVYNASFPSNTWGGAYNVAKSNNINSVTFINESGGFAGDSYENDPNGKIFWSLSGRWTGLVSHDWHTGGNWYYNSIPDASTVVYIPSSVPFMPWVQTDGFCKSLTLDESAFLKLLNANLTISTYADILGELDVDSSAVLTLDSLNFKPGSTGRADWRGYIRVIGDLTIHEGADVHLDEGILYFINSKYSTFTNQADSAFIWALINQKPSAFWLKYGSGSTGTLVVQNNFTNSAGSRFISDSPEGIVFQGRFRNSGGIIQANDGTITLAGDPYYALRTGDGSYFNGLTLKTTTHLKLDNNYPDSLVVNGVLKIEPNLAGSSGLEARVNTALPAMPILLKGDWVNNAGTGAFVHGSGRVNFLRTAGDQNIFGHTNFYDVADSTQSAFRLKFFNFNSIMNNLTVKHRVAICDTLMVYGTVDLNLNNAYLYLEENGYLETEILDQGGHLVGNSGFFMNYDLAENEITGDYQLNGATISISQLDSKTIDLNGAISISSGEMWIYGGNGASKWPSNTGTASLTMSGGILGVYNGIYLNNDNFTENISGGTIRTPGNFTIYDDVSTFHPIGGTVEMTGNTNSVVSMFPAGCWFHNLKISKGNGFQVTPEDYVNIKGELRISSGTFKTSGQTIQVGD